MSDSDFEPGEVVGDSAAPTVAASLEAEGSPTDLEGAESSDVEVDIDVTSPSPTVDDDVLEVTAAAPADAEANGHVDAASEESIQGPGWDETTTRTTNCLSSSRAPTTGPDGGSWSTPTPATRTR